MSGYADIYEATVEPKTCETCEYNCNGVCGGGDGREGHTYGHKINDKGDTCGAWGASYEVYTAAYNRAKAAGKGGRRK